MKIYVFSEFTGLEALSKYCKVIVSGPIIKEDSSDEIKRIARTNIKIFFDKDEKDREDAYALQKSLEDDGIAIFVTDQLYSTHKDANGKPYQVALPKDRIIMRLN